MQNPINWVRTFWLDVTAELKKCTWPTRRELTDSTVLVIVSMIILSLFVAFSDWVSQTVIRLLTVRL